MNASGALRRNETEFDEKRRAVLGVLSFSAEERP